MHRLAEWFIFLGGHDWSFLKEGIKTYLIALMLILDFLSCWKRSNTSEIADSPLAFLRL